MSKRVDKLITQIRNFTENSEFGDNEGISDSEFLQALNDAVNRLQSLIVSKHSKAFLKETVIPVLPLVRSYQMPIDAFLGSKVYNVELSETGNEDDYFKLKKTSLHLKSTQDSMPCEYYTMDEKIVLNPIPDTASSMRVTYTKRAANLDKRRGIVEIAVLDSLTNSISNLQLDVSSATTVLDSDELNACDYICVVDKRGAMKMRNIPISSVNSASGVVTIDSFTFEEGETINVGDYVVCGEDTSTHPIDFPRTVERYLISYGKWYILKRDSSADYAEAQAELLAIEDDIVGSYSDEDLDITLIPDLGGCW